MVLLGLDGCLVDLLLLLLLFLSLENGLLIGA